MNRLNSNVLVVILVCIFSLSLVQCNNSKEKDKSDKSNKELTNDIKTEKKEPELVYDDRGNIIERHSNSYKKKDGSLRSIEDYYYTFDDNNNLIEETKISHNPEGEMLYKNVNHYIYNELNQKIEQNFFTYNKEDVLQRQARITFEYNERGQLVKEDSYFLDGAIKSTIIRDPNEEGALQSEEYLHFNPDGSKKDHKKYYYNQYGLEKTVDLMEE